MDPFARKMILGTLAFAVFMLTILAALSVFYLHTHPRCSEQLLFEKPSPDGRLIAAVLRRRCGEESPLFVHVNLRSTASPLDFGFFSGRADDGEVFTAEQDSFENSLEVDWLSAAQLRIRCPACGPAHVEHGWGPVAVQ